MVVHACILSSQEAEASLMETARSKPARTTYGDPPISKENGREGKKREKKDNLSMFESPLVVLVS